MQQSSPSPRWFSVDTLTVPKLVTWAEKSNDLETLRGIAALRGVEIGDVSTGQRTRTDGVELTWKLTSPLTVIADGVVPFLIDWGTSAHPAASAAQGLRLVDLRAEHPAADDVQRMLPSLGVTLTVRYASTTALIATIDGPRGRIELR